jgi:SAM-dependent methyltransferase
MESDSRDRVIVQWSQKILARLEEILPSRPTEADFRRKIDPLLEEFCTKVGVTPLAHAEYTLATGRADAVFNRLVIEYERPGVLKKSPDAATRHAIQQVKDYLEGLAKKEHRQVERLAGVVFDGHFLIFVRFASGKWVVEDPVEVNEHSLARFLTWLAGLSSGIALTAANLNRDFSIEQHRTKDILRGLFQALGPALDRHGGLVPKLFEQWRLFFSEAIDYSEAFGGRKLEALKKWVRKADFEIKSASEAERFFFVLHTYFALLLKLLAWLALSRHLGVKLGAPSFASLITADGETLRRRLQEMESGGIFRAYGILNLLEGDFFTWYLYAWNDKIESALREILKRLDEYDPTTLTLLPEETRDLFKKLYHYLLPREIRHNLGEYYTPDWLAQRLLVQVDNEFFATDPRRGERRLRDKLLHTRFLDPACGSGTFPVLIIARMLELGRAFLVPERELLDSILRNVVGFDLNPLAVLTARVNYLLAIAELLEYRRGGITIPIYLADSVRTPTLGEELFNQKAYNFFTAVGGFQVPAALCAPERFDRLCEIIEESLGSELEADSFIRRLERELSLSPPQWNENAVSLARALYEEMLKLHRDGMNGLWARLLKNNFAPLTVGQFDYIVGNPPWVNWEHLPDGYRVTLIPLYQDTYKLFPHKGQRARHGSTKIDISTLMLYVAVDKLLKIGGKLGFLITQSVFKTDAGKGFRRFSISQRQGQEIPLKVIYVDDMVALQPFEGASNRTAVMVLEKGKPTTYPVPYTVWRKQGRKRFTYDSTLEEVTNATVRLNFAAEPVNPSDPTSPWLTARPKAIKAVRKVLGKSDYEAHEGVNTGGANAVYWVDIVYKRPDGLVVVRNITEGAKVKVDEVTEPIEPDLLYPLLRGRDVQRWQAEPSALIIVPQDPTDAKHGYPEKKLMADYPRCYGYLAKFHKVLENRPAYKKYLQPFGEPWYSLYDVKNYTFAPWKVVWTRVANDIAAAVVGHANVAGEHKPVVPIETATLVDFTDFTEAYYFCAVVNSCPWRLVIVSTAVHGTGGFGSPNVLEKARIPRFDRKNPVHLRLAELSKQAHEAAKVGDEMRLREIEAEIDRQAAKLWGLSDDELREIQQSLRELAGEEEPQAEEQP